MSIRTCQLSCSIISVCIQYDWYKRLSFDPLIPLCEREVFKMRISYLMTFLYGLSQVKLPYWCRSSYRRQWFVHGSCMNKKNFTWASITGKNISSFRRHLAEISKFLIGFIRMAHSICITYQRELYNDRGKGSRWGTSDVVPWYQINAKKVSYQTFIVP
jgi:hypothetical protein